MPLPRIAPYDSIDACSLPLNRVSWAVDPDRAALLIHDMQNYFLRAFAPGGPVASAVANIQRLASVCRAAGIPVIYTAQPARQTMATRGLLMEFWGPGLGGQPDDDRIVASLAPAPGEPVITKHRYSAFHHTDLSDVLEAHRRDQLLITGVYAHLGCMLTAVDAFALGVQAFLVADAVADFDRDRHCQALRYVADSCGMVTVTEEVFNSAAGSGR